MPTFAEYLKELMLEKKIGVNELAEISGVSGAHISRIINEKRPAPGPKTIKKLSSSLSVSYEEMMNIAGYISNNDLSVNQQEKKCPKDLATILAEQEIMFSGTPLDEEDKQEIYDIIQYRLYKRAKELKKRNPKTKN